MRNRALEMLSKLSQGERAYVGGVTGGFITCAIQVAWITHKHNQLAKEYNELAERARKAGMAFDQFGEMTAYLIRCVEESGIQLEQFDVIAIHEMMREVKAILDNDTDFE